MTWCIAGHGKVASALAQRLTERGVAFEQVSARGWANGNELPSTDCRALFWPFPTTSSQKRRLVWGLPHPAIPSFIVAVQPPCQPWRLCP